MIKRWKSEKKEKAPPDRPGLGLACRWAAGTSTRSAAREAQSEKNMEIGKKEKAPPDIRPGLAGPIFWPLRA